MIRVSSTQAWNSKPIMVGYHMSKSGSLFTLCLDSIGSVAFHPSHSTLISASGSRHFHLEDDDTENSDTSSESDGGEDKNAEGRAKNISSSILLKRTSRPHPVTLDSSVKLWNFGPGTRGRA